MTEDRSSTSSTINVGSRCSELALCQTNLVIQRLKEQDPQINFNVIKMTTKGDQILDKALNKIGGKSLFTKELEIALDNGQVDFVVHSLKDLPTTLPPGLTIGAVIKRHDPRDCVVLHAKHRAVTRLSALPAGSVLGTSSLRRIAQLARHYPHLQFENIRGNLNTRLRKLDDDNKYDGIVLAAAGIERLGWKDRVNVYLEKHDMMYAVSQGAMAVECREDDVETISMLSKIHDQHTALRVTAERVFMKELDGGCSVPLGTWSVLDKHELHLSGAVFSIDGKEMLFSERTERMPSNEFLPHLPALFPTSDFFSHHQVDMIHGQRPKLTSDVLSVKGLLNNNIIVHRTGMCCSTNDVSKYDSAERCGLQIAASLIRKGAREVLERARAAGNAENVNEAPKKCVVEKKSIVSTQGTNENLVDSTPGTSSEGLVSLEDIIPEVTNHHFNSLEGPPCKKSRQSSSS